MYEVECISMGKNDKIPPTTVTIRCVRFDEANAVIIVVALMWLVPISTNISASSSREPENKKNREHQQEYQLQV